MSERDELDQLIDSALSTYAEPRPGVEQRVLARVSGEVARSSRRRWVFAAIGAPAIAVLILLSYVVSKTLDSKPAQMANTPAIASVTPVVAAPAPHAVPKSGSSRHVRRGDQIAHESRLAAIPRPKLDTFPLIQPLNAEEQSLVRFATEAPEADRKALFALQPDLGEPIQITAIHIKPLPSFEEEKN